MDNKEFDHIIKDSLSNLDRTDIPASSWEMMKSHMFDESSVDKSNNLEDDKLFDQYIKNSVVGHQVGFNEDHSKQLFDQLNAEKIKKRNIFFHWASRAAVFLLFSLSLFQFYQNGFFNNESEMAIGNERLIDHSAHKNVIANLFVSDFDISESPITSVIKSIFGKKEISIPTTNTISIENPIEINQALFTMPNTVNDSPLQGAITNMDARQLLLEKDVNDINNVTLSRQINIKDTKINETYVSGHAGYSSYNNYDASGNATNLNTEGWNTGVNISKRVGNIEIETGVEYSNVRFDPSKNNYIYGTQTDAKEFVVEDVDLVVSGIPIEAKYHIPVNEKISIYTLVGAKYNAILKNQSSNSIAEVDHLRSFRETIETEKPYLGGLLQGGTFKENSFISASIGLGMEYGIDDHSIAFVEPSYETQLYPSLLKNTNDELKGINIKLGFKRRI